MRISRLKPLRRPLLGMTIQILLIIYVCILAYVYPESIYYQRGFWIIAYLLTYSNIYDTRMILNYKRRTDPHSKFHGRLYGVALGIAFLWSAVIHILGIYDALIQKNKLVSIITVHLGIIMLPIFLYTWSLMRRLKNPYPVFAVFLSSLQLILLALISATTIVVSGRSITLIELAVRYPSKYIVVNLHLIVGAILIGLYLSRVGRTRYGAISSLILAVIEFILRWAIFIGDDFEFDTIGVWRFLHSIALGILVLLPQIFWAEYFWKKPRTSMTDEP